MGILAVIMLVVGCLATGSTRHTVYRAWKARVGGRLSCAIVSTNNNLLHNNLNLII
jgi:Myelin proteolipid protein (PLP or lipophilin)